MKCTIFITSGTAWLLTSPGASIPERLKYLVYFTNVSILVCFFLYGYITVESLVKFKQTDGYYYRSVKTAFLKGALLVMLVFTMLVFHFGLSMTEFAEQVNQNLMNRVVNILLHYAIPVLCVLDWVLFDRKGSFRLIYPIAWLIIPFVYFLLVMLRAEFGTLIPHTESRFPYFFFDIDDLGFADVLAYALWFAIAFMVMGYIVVLVDKIMEKHSLKLAKKDL